MIPFRRFILLILAGLLGFAPAFGQLKPGPVRKGAVAVELVSRDASIQPGRPFLVALKMEHDPHWHSYWIHAGTGYPTSIDWNLPEGFSAGPMQWTTPHVVRDRSGKLTGNGYEGTVLHFVEITPPAGLKAGADVTLRASVEWLMCDEVCMPGDAKLELTLPVGRENPGAHPSHAKLFDSQLAQLPHDAGAEWTFSASRDGKAIVLRAIPSAGTAHVPEGLHFFASDGLVDYESEQPMRREGGAYVVELKTDPAAAPDAARLTGVLASKSGWAPGSGYQGIAVDVAFSKPAPKTAAASDVAPQPPPPSGGLFGTLMLAFVGGLILNLMPCVFPVLGIKILGFVNQAGSERGEVVKHGLVFTAGVLASFWALAALLLALRAGGQELGWGFQLQSPAFVFGMAVFLLIFALNMSGLFEIGLSATGAGAALQSREGLTGSFFTGALATLVATPCSAPFLAPALGAALTLSALESFAVFTAIAVGLSLPYLLLSMFPAAVKLLPKPGAWMETFKQLMAFPLYATVGWLLWVLAAQTQGDDYGLLMIALGFVLVAMAAWAYGRFGQPHGKPARKLAGNVSAAALLVAGLWLGWPKDLSAVSDTEGYQVEWQKWSAEAVAAARAEGKYVYVDFTARWCATCQTNKAAVFSSDELLRRFDKLDVVLLKADWTNRDPKITQELARWNRSAVPFNLIYAPGRNEPVVLPELLTAGTVLDALGKIAN